ncbi:MAG TPA: hypothetical protein VFO78_02140 [Candidatus Limnocylindrales bacterium]|nr:hypothetical protein [Candidatus Limnocylindrales bacterium]
MSDARDDLRATSESIRHDAERLAALEAEKSAIDPENPRVLELSREIEELTRRLAHEATAERELSEEIQDQADGPPA